MTSKIQRPIVDWPQLPRKRWNAKLSNCTKGVCNSFNQRLTTNSTINDEKHPSNYSPEDHTLPHPVNCMPISHISKELQRSRSVIISFLCNQARYNRKNSDERPHKLTKSDQRRIIRRVHLRISDLPAS